MWRSFYLCFYSKAFYRDVAQNWRGLGLGFLLLLLMIFCIPMSLRASTAYRLFVDTYGQEMIEKLPVITVKDHKLSIDKAQPYVVYGPEKYSNGAPKELLIFDNTGKHKIENLYPGQVLITDHYIHVRKNNTSGEISSLPLDKFPDAVVDHPLLIHFFDMTKHWFLPVFYIGALVFLYIGYIIKVLIYGLIGMLINRLMGAFLEYPQLVRLSVIAITPLTVIDTVLMIIPGLNAPSGWIAFFISMGFLTFGIHANRELIR